MPVFLLYVIGAGLVSGGAYVLSEAHRKRVAQEALGAQRYEAQILSGELALEDLRRRAREAGVDPEKVSAAYQAVRSQRIDLSDAAADVLRMLGGSAGPRAA